MKKILILGMIISMMGSTALAYDSNEELEKAMPIQAINKTIENPVPTLYENQKENKDSIYNCLYNENEIAKTVELDGVTMIPLREVLESMDFKINWNSEKSIVEINKGAQWTSLKIGENAYFKNKMASQPLSKEPIIINDKTFVPIEFLNEILNISILIEENNITFEEQMMSKHSGYIQEIRLNEGGDIVSITISSEIESKGFEDQVILNVSKNNTIIQKKLEKGKMINAITKPMMTMSLPGQTPAVVIY